MKDRYEELKGFLLAALEGRRRVLGEEHKNTLATLNNLELVFQHMEDNERAPDYYQQALRVQEKAMGKTHPGTLPTIMNMACTYHGGLKHYAVAEEMYRLALDGREKSLRKDHEDIKLCAEGLAQPLACMKSKYGTKQFVPRYLHLLDAHKWDHSRLVKKKAKKKTKRVGICDPSSCHGSWREPRRP